MREKIRSLLGILLRPSNIFLAGSVCSVTLLLFLPLLPFFLRTNHTDNSNSTDRLVALLSDGAMKSNSSLMCSPQSYNGSLCLQELLDWQMCLPGRQNETKVFIPSDIDQGVREEMAQVLFTDFQLPSGCLSEFKSFWCLYLFGICDGIDQRRLPTYDHCISFQNNTCYKIVEKAIEGKPLPLECNFEEHMNCKNNEKVSSNETISCSDQFYYEKTSQTCKPECGVWTLLPTTAANTLRAFHIVINAIGLVGCIAVFVLTWVNRKRLLVFPTVLVIYQMMVLLLDLLIKETNLLLKDSLKCNSRDLIENLSPGQSATFCQISGAIHFYTMYVVAILWLSQSAIFFWGVMWPIHYSVTKTLGRIKYVHITVVVISFILPITFVLGVQFSGGFGLSISGTLSCFVREPEDRFYGNTLPLNLIVIPGIILMVITGWKIADFKNRCCKTQSSKPFRRKTTQNKILLLTSYVSIVTLYSTSTMNNLLSEANEIKKEVATHFMCEALGEDMECSRDSIHQFENDIYASSLSHVLLGLLPSIYFLFLLDYRFLCRKCTLHVSSCI